MPKKKAGRAAAGAPQIRKITYSKKGVEYTYWAVDVTTGFDPGTGRQIQKRISGKTQKEVRQKLTEIQSQLDNGTYTAPSKMTVAEWFQVWLDTFCEGTLKPLTLETYREVVRFRITPALGSLKLQEVHGYHIQNLYNGMTKKGLSPKTVKNAGAILHKGFSVAMKQGLIPANPCDAAELPKAVHKEIKPLSDEIIPVFLKAVDGHPMQNIFRFCLFTGLREGELLGLSWKDVDLKAGRITVCQQLQKEKKKGGKSYIAPFTKSSRPRVVELPPIAVDCLKDEKRRQTEARLKAGPAWSNEWNLVFTTESGRYVDISTFYRNFKRVAASIGRPDARPHDLRHTWATSAIASGADIKSVQDSLGHATAAFTLAVYTHPSEKMKKDAAARMQAVFGNYEKTAKEIS